MSQWCGGKGKITLPARQKNKHHVQYPDVPSTIKLVPYGSDLPVPEPNVTMKCSSDFESSDMTDTAECATYRPEEDDQLVTSTQAELNDRTRDLNLFKESAQLLGSLLRETSTGTWNNILLVLRTRIWIFIHV